MAIFGRVVILVEEHSLTGEGLRVLALDTFVATMALIISAMSFGWMKWTGISFCDTAKYF